MEFCTMNLLDSKVFQKASAFVVDKEGKITYSWSSDDPKQLPDFNAIKEVL